MKKLITFVTLSVALMLSGFTVAQTYHADDVACLRSFLQQNSGVSGKINAERFGLTPAEIQSGDAWVDKLTQMRAVTWNNAQPKRLIRVGDEQSWSRDKRLSGNLNASAWTELISLNCSMTELKSVIVSGCTKLEYLYCEAVNSGGAGERDCLKDLDVTKNTALKVLNCGGNELTVLDVSKNTELRYLNCTNNKISAVNVGECTKLTALLCGANRIATLDVHNCLKLDTLDCQANLISTLDVSLCTSLTRFTCNTNKLTTLDLTPNTKLKVLECNANLLTDLDLAANTLLTNLACTNNKLTTLNLKGLTQLKNLSCDNNKLIELDLTNNAQLSSLYASGNELYSLKLHPATNLANASCQRNHLLLSDLYNISIRAQTKWLGEQTWAKRIVQIDVPIPYEPEQNLFNNVYTTYPSISRDGNAATEGIDYTITEGKLTLKVGGTYAVTLMNTGIASAEMDPARAKATYVVYDSPGHDNTNLANLTVSEGVLSPAFSVGTLLYTVEVANGITEITITATPEDEEATVEGNGTFSLRVGDNEFVIKVISADFSDYREYTVKVKREKGGPGPGIIETASQSAMKIYPNPVISQLHIELSTPETADYILYNSVGQQVMSGKVQNDAILNVESLSKGIYYLRIKDMTAKIIK